MSAAVEVHRPSGFFNSGGGYEFPALLGLVAAALGLSGPGRFSLDHATGDRLNSAATLVGAFAVTALATKTVLDKRRQAVAQQAAEADEDAEAELP
jgi:putative oxidoreductase